MTRKQRAIQTARNRAKRGAEYLDKKFGGKRWARDIRVTELDLDSCCGCIRGQLETAGRIGDREMIGLDNHQTYYPAEFGMHTRGDDDVQQDAWIEEIRARR